MTNLNDTGFPEIFIHDSAPPAKLLVVEGSPNQSGELRYNLPKDTKHDPFLSPFVRAITIGLTFGVKQQSINHIPR